MNFSYRSTLVDHETNRGKNFGYTLDTDRWLAHVAEDKLGFYGNSAELIKEYLLPLLESDKLDELHDSFCELYEQWRKHNWMIVFEFAMFVWAGFKEGRYSAEAWATIFATAWQGGSRGMLAGVKLSQAQVIQMFLEAPRKQLLKCGSWEGIDLQKAFDELPSEIQVYRQYSSLNDLAGVSCHHFSRQENRRWRARLQLFPRAVGSPTTSASA